MYTSTISFGTLHVFAIAYSTLVHNPTAQDKHQAQERLDVNVAMSTNMAYTDK